ncbi:hypothetical protein ACIRRA_10705 [Nocardia sp. NPDC101769]|uniref:hypothetical protein n=1 Tax=Nocardia sp. NPDC101769 TaxID=3364333 RepID=UPI0038153600
MPHTALTQPASARHRKINWPCRSEAGGTSATAECRAFGGNEIVEAADDEQLTKAIARYGRVDLALYRRLSWQVTNQVAHI